MAGLKATKDDKNTPATKDITIIKEVMVFVAPDAKSSLFRRTKMPTKDQIFAEAMERSVRITARLLQRRLK